MSTEQLREAAAQQEKRVADLERQAQKADGEKLGAIAATLTMAKELAGIFAARLREALDFEAARARKAQAETREQERAAALTALAERKADAERRWIAMASDLTAVDASMRRLAGEFQALTQAAMEIAKEDAALGGGTGQVDVGPGGPLFTRIQQGLWPWFNWAIWRTLR